MNIRKYNSILSSLSGHGESLSSLTPYKQRIPLNNKRKKTSDTSIKENKLFKNHTTQVKQQKRIVYLMQKNKIKTPPPFKNKENYIGDTNEKNRRSDDSPSETDDCAINLGEEHEN